MKILLLLLTFTLFCCNKESTKFKYCYHCIFGIGVGGYTRPPLDTCSDVEARYYHFTDSRNNDQSFYCEPR